MILNCSLLPQDKWLEISSVSTFEGFQSERLRLRYKSKAGSKPPRPYTLNGKRSCLTKSTRRHTRKLSNIRRD